MSYYLSSKKRFLGTTVCAVILAALAQRYAPWSPSALPFFLFPSSSTTVFTCNAPAYSTEIVSLDPLVIYINNFVSSTEAEGLVAQGTPSLASSQVYLHGQKVPSSERTSRSAGLAPSPVVDCVLGRAKSFLGTILDEDGDFGTPQVVSYRTGEKFDIHHDWYDAPQRLKDGRWFNRIASFFVFLEEEELVGGETWFPYLEGREMVEGGEDGEMKWRRHEDGGVAFKPKGGNAVFWMNLFRNGTGDGRVVHAGLPLGGGTKTAMNIWPRKFYKDGR